MKIIFALILNLAILGMECYAIIGELRKKEPMVQYYTFDSNVIGGISSGILGFYLLFRVIGGLASGLSLAETLETVAAVPAWMAIFKYWATCWLALTIIVVVTVLAPMEGKGGYKEQLVHPFLRYEHVFCPILAIISFLFLDPTPAMGWQVILIPWFATWVYAAIVTVRNVTRKMHGPYPFLYVHEQPVWASVLWGFAILAGDLGIVWLTWFLKGLMIG